MTLKQRLVRANISNPDGSAAPYAAVQATLTTYEVDGMLIVPTVVRGQTDATGTCLLELWPNDRGVNGSQYNITATKSGALLLNVLATVPDGNSATEILLESIITPTTPPAVDAATQAVIAAQALVDEATTQADTATAKAVLTAADRVQTGLDRVQTGLDRTQTGLDRTAASDSAAAALASQEDIHDNWQAKLDAADAAKVAAELAETNTATLETNAVIAKTAAEAARDAALAGDTQMWPTTAAGIGQGVQGIASLVGGTGGADGTFALAFSGGTQILAPVGNFVVAGGIVTQITITYKGYYSAGTPTLSFAASAGSTATATAVMAANTAAGGYFTALSTDSTEVIVYQNVGGTATERYRLKTQAYIDALVDAFAYDSETLMQGLDSAGRVLWKVITDGTFLAKFGIAIGTANGLTFTRQIDDSYLLSLGTTAGRIPLSDCAIGGDLNNEDVLYYLVDNATDKRVLVKIAIDGTITGKFVSPEVVTARGTQASLSARLAHTQSTAGFELKPVYQAYRLREYRRLTRQIATSVASSQLSIVSLGDSWTDGQAYWALPVYTDLRALYGDAGVGYKSFGWVSTGSMTVTNDAIDSTLISAVGSGTWACAWAASTTVGTAPDMRTVASSTAGSKFTCTIAAGHTSVLFYAMGGAGVCRYRWNGGAWTTIDLSALAATAQIITLAGMPGSGTVTLEIEVVSGANVWCGIEARKTANGVRWNKVAASGSYLSQWVSMDATIWQAWITAMAPNLVTICFGTNDQSQYTAATFKTHYETLITRVQAAVPYADILLIAPPENLNAAARSMADYQQATQELAETYGCSFINLQYAFGDVVSPDYGYGTGRPLIGSDNTHPNNPNGRAVIQDAVLRLLQNSQ